MVFYCFDKTSACSIADQSRKKGSFMKSSFVFAALAGAVLGTAVSGCREEEKKPD